MNVAGNIRKWLTFGLSEEQEDRFRKINFGADITQARIFIFLIILPFAVLIVNDYSFFGLSRTFYGILAFRLAIVAYTTLFFKNLPELQNYQSYDRSEFIWGLILALTQITLNTTRPEGFVAHTVAIILSIFVMVLAIPNKFTNQLILSLVYVIGQTLVIIPSMWISSQASFTVLLNMFVASIVAIASSWLFHFWRRREFLNREEIQKAKEETEIQLIERQKAEEALTKIETARRQEIHHRIKNNLQVISSLMDLQAEKFKNKEYVKDSEVLEAFKEGQDRVISMALIHEELYKGGGLKTLNFSPYINELAKNLFQTYSLGNTTIRLKFDLEEYVFFDMDIAVPLGIIVNEVITNSLKHAFPNRKEGEVQIKLFSEQARNEPNNKEEPTEKSTRNTLIVSDNGIGIPEEIDFENSETLGLQLINILVNQLDGEIELKRDKGTEFIIRFSSQEKEN